MIWMYRYYQQNMLIMPLISMLQLKKWN